MSESGQRSKVVRALKPLGAFAVENPIHPGTPDVNYIEGWIELKWLRSWPKRKETIVRIDHYTQQQRLWLSRRHAKGGKAFLLLQVKREWFLFKPPDTDLVGKLTREDLIRHAYKYWKDGLREKELIECVS